MSKASKISDLSLLFASLIGVLGANCFAPVQAKNEIKYEDRPIAVPFEDSVRNSARYTNVPATKYSQGRLPIVVRLGARSAGNFIYESKLGTRLTSQDIYNSLTELPQGYFRQDFQPAGRNIELRVFAFYTFQCNSQRQLGFSQLLKTSSAGRIFVDTNLPNLAASGNLINLSGINPDANSTNFRLCLIQSLVKTIDNQTIAPPISAATLDNFSINDSSLQNVLKDVVDRYDQSVQGLNPYIQKFPYGSYL